MLFAEQVPDRNGESDKFDTGTMGLRRRVAIKHQKIHEVMGHQFIAKFFRQPVFCSYCSDFCW